ncbi:copper resistance protein B [Oceanimonas sp. NS1]|nr:copper resistance protein B [Oceanimonas sp. NS1]
MEPCPDGVRNSELGVRYDTGHGPDQGWLAAGVSGLAPYWRGAGRHRPPG